MLSEYTMTFISLEVAYIIIVGYVAFKFNKNIGTVAEVRHFRLIQLFFIAEAISQLLWMFNSSGIWKMSRFMVWFVNLAYLCTFGLCMFEWLRFIAEKVHFLGSKRLTALALRCQTVAMILHMLMIGSSVWTEWIFYVDANGVYQRGNLFWINIALCYSHWVWTTILIMTNRKNASGDVRHQLKNLFIISLLPVFGGILQCIFYNVPFLESTDMLSIFFLFAVSQENQIKTDALTGLNNRSQFEKAYERMLSKADMDPFVIFVADINRFKHINDAYGHLAGDQALLLVAEGLRLLGQKYPSLDAFRYGGDEFVLLALCKDISEPELFADEVNACLLQTESQASLPFEVKFSIGYQVVKDTLVDGKKAFAAADTMLYDSKRPSMVLK